MSAVTVGKSSTLDIISNENQNQTAREKREEPVFVSIVRGGVFVLLFSCDWRSAPDAIFSPAGSFPPLTKRKFSRQKMKEDGQSNRA